MSANRYQFEKRLMERRGLRARPKHCYGPQDMTLEVDEPVQVVDTGSAMVESDDVEAAASWHVQLSPHVLHAIHQIAVVTPRQESA